MNSTVPLTADSPAWRFQTWAAFVLSLFATSVGIWWVSAGAWEKAFLGLGLWFTVSSSFALAKAERDLDFTSVRAPVDGNFSNRLVNTGDFIQAGQRLANVVPLNDVFIDANFKETQLKRIRPGQPVKISVDGA